MSNNLPDDVTPADIDDAFGGEPDTYLSDVMIGATIDVTAWSEDDARDNIMKIIKKEIGPAIEVEHIEIMQIDRT